MKKLLLVGATMVALVGGVFAFNIAKSQPVEAATCEVTVLNNKEIKISPDGKTATSTIKTMGNCVERYATLSVWKLPNATGHPLQEQEFFGYQTKKLVPGITTLTVELPDCYWQVDLLGQKRPKSIYGDANYDAMGKDVLVNFKLGGDKSCTPPPTPEKCPVPGMENLPADDPDCKVEPETPVTPEEPEAPVTPVAVSLPDTGPGAVAAIFSGITAAGSGVAHYVFRRRKLM